MVFSLLEVVEEGPGSAGGAPVLQANVVVLTVEELPPFWVETVVLGTGVGLWGRFISVAVMAAGAAVDFGTRALEAPGVLRLVVEWVAGTGLVVPPGAGVLLGTSRVLVPRVTAGLVTPVLGGALPVAPEGGTELGEVALGLVAARMVVRRVTTGVVVVLFGVADWWMRHGVVELGAGVGRAVGVAAGPTVVLGRGVETRGAVLVGRVGLTAFGVGVLGLVFGVVGGWLLVAMGLGEVRRAMVVVGAAVVGALLAEVAG